MADTNHHHAPTEPVEGDGVSYRGIVWFIVILTLTTFFCQALVWGLFRVMEYRVAHSGVVRAPLAAPATSPRIERGKLVSGAESAPLPGLNVNEPVVLHEFRASEDHDLSNYGWADKTAQVVRLPIARGKDLVIERGLPTRAAVAPSVAQPAALTPAAEGKAQPSKANAPKAASR